MAWLGILHMAYDPCSIYHACIDKRPILFWAAPNSSASTNFPAARSCRLWFWYAIPKFTSTDTTNLSVISLGLHCCFKHWNAMQRVGSISTADLSDRQGLTLMLVLILLVLQEVRVSRS